ncbi:hypothetical protein WJX73_008892 [Symbiochloris irregularis]|uniref:N-acetyltransferase domain-containing protein n=1 Tax=Symbiochloris irregularis TaxID=706552 RepID=A0AAW1PV18_9CHLO
MRQNQGKQLVGKSVKLVPYAAAHVPKYHKWMQDPEILKATASEPLSLEAKHEMQRKWVTDEDKCTFIVLDQDLITADGAPDHLEAMVGDTNLFLRESEDGAVAELEVMIAEVGSRRKGLASQAVVMMMQWALQHLGLHKFEVKIGDANAASLALFKRLGFTVVGHSDVFEETCLALEIKDAHFGMQNWEKMHLQLHDTRDADRRLQSDRT